MPFKVYLILLRTCGYIHSIQLCALLFLAKRNGVVNNVDDLWGAALLHDLGKLVYLKFFPDHFVMLKNYAQEHGIPFSTAEGELEMPPSAYMGTLLCDHWKLPLSVRKACEAHTLEFFFETDKSIYCSPSLRFVGIGNLLSILSTNGLNGDFKEEIEQGVRKFLNHDELKFETLMMEVDDMKTDAETFMCQFI